uniref:Uncharacterized protein n=1 Tax=Nelumbo nucifera TaxID=4432 RepID=A0A822XYA8_NELNU|nr:TPA_asm: hypothetical protein HUJ06_026814 [Nelumbo nucifera]
MGSNAISNLIPAHRKHHNRLKLLGRFCEEDKKTQYIPTKRGRYICSQTESSRITNMTSDNGDMVADGLSRQGAEPQN